MPACNDGISSSRSNLFARRQEANNPPDSYSFVCFSVFLVVSDDMVWCKRNLAGSDIFMVGGNSPQVLFFSSSLHRTVMDELTDGGARDAIAAKNLFQLDSNFAFD